MASEVCLTLSSKESLLIQQLVDSLQSLLNAAINLVNFGYWLAGEPTISVPDLTWTASVEIEVPKLIVDFTRASSECPHFILKRLANVLSEVTEGTCFNPNDNQNYEVDFFIGASLNAGLTGYDVPSSMNNVDLLVSLSRILYSAPKILMIARENSEFRN